MMQRCSALLRRCHGRAPATLKVAMSSRALVSSRHSHNGARLQFPPLPPQLAERYRPGQMLQHEDSLPKLPVPPLQQTLKKYLASAEPLMSAAELERTKEVVADFARPGGEGEKLQTKLLERASKMDNWLSDWWLDVAYLSFRLPVEVNVSPILVYTEKPMKDTDTFVKTAATYLMSFLKWNLLLESNAIPPEMYRKNPMTMHAFKHYSTSRLPGLGTDVRRKTDIAQSRHVIVVHNGHFYRLDVLYETAAGDLAVAPSSHILGQLRAILDRTSEPASHPVGLLTAEHRDTWYHARERLRSDTQNTASLEAMEMAQFVLCLDSNRTPSSVQPGSDEHMSLVARRLLHGNGSQHYSGNRWFDTSIQIVVGGDGGCGSILEHSVAEAPPALTGNEFVAELIHKLKYDVLAEVSPVEPAHLRPAELLHWNISPETIQDIDAAQAIVDKLVQDTDYEVVVFKDFGKNYPKTAKLSPDAFIQLALQLAYYRHHSRPTAMYESGATRWFKLGRTDTIRSATSVCLHFSRTMCDDEASVNERANALVCAANSHIDLTNEAIIGQGIDRHLLGLKMISDEAGQPLHPLFIDPTYQRTKHHGLSTSQVSSRFPIFCGFGATVPDGYGVCYNPQESQIIFSITSFRSCAHTDSQLLGQMLKEALRDMRDVLVAADGLRSKL